jgi:hypothetical protein
MVNVSRWQLNLPVGYARTPAARRGRQKHATFVSLQQYVGGQALVSPRRLTALQRRDLVIARLAAVPRFKVSTGTGVLDRGLAIRALLEGAPEAKLLLKIELGCIDALLRRVARAAA